MRKDVRDRPRDSKRSRSARALTLTRRQQRADKARMRAVSSR